MSEEDLQAFQGASNKDLEKLVVKDPAKKRSIEASRAHAQLGQSTIKCGALVDSMAHVIDEAAAQTTAHIDDAIVEIGTSGRVDTDRVQTAAIVNSSLAFAGFSAADLGCVQYTRP